MYFFLYKLFVLNIKKQNYIYVTNINICQTVIYIKKMNRESIYQCIYVSRISITISLALFTNSLSLTSNLTGCNRCYVFSLIETLVKVESITVHNFDHLFYSTLV